MIKRWLKRGAAVVVAVHVAGTVDAAATKPVAPAPARTEGRITLLERDGTLIVVGAGGKRSLMYLKPATRISRGGKKAGLLDLRVGDEVSAVYYPEGAVVELTAEPPGASAAPLR